MGTTRGCNGRIQEKQLEKNQRREGAGAMQMYVASTQQTRKSISYVGNGLIRTQITSGTRLQTENISFSFFFFLEKAVGIGMVWRGGRREEWKIGVGC